MWQDDGCRHDGNGGEHQRCFELTSQLVKVSYPARHRRDVAEHRMHALQVAGTVAADTLEIGNITVKNQGFGLVLSSSRDFLDISCDGLFVSTRTPFVETPLALCIHATPG